MAVSPNGRVYISDPAGHHLWAYQNNGQIDTTFGDNGSIDAGGSLAVDKDNNLYIGNGESFTKYSPTGTLLLQWSTIGKPANQFHRVYSMAVDRQNRLVVAYAFNGDVQIFDTNGQSIALWPASEPADAPAYYIATDKQGYIYLTVKDGIKVFDSTGDVVARYTSAASYADGGFSRPEGMAVDDAGGIYLSYPSANLIMKYHFQ